MMQPCRECGKEISSDAAKCPHCGVASVWRTRAQWTWLAVSVFLAISLFLYELSTV